VTTAAELGADPALMQVAPAQPAPTRGSQATVSPAQRSRARSVMGLARLVGQAAVQVAGDRAEAASSGCRRRTWVPFVLALLDVGRRIVTELDNRSNCDSTDACDR
jgi:hypothetical protein